jgi:hypothetical protein
MSGILDNKQRIIDTVITTEGRRQLALGGIDIKYVTFTDGATFYKADLVSGSQDATQRIYFESCQLPQDDITFQADDQGNLQTFRNSDSIPLAGGQILDYSFAAISSSVIAAGSPGLQTTTTLRGTAFSDASEKLLASSADNFSKLRIIASVDPIFEDDAFGLGPNQVAFTINSTRPIQDPAQFATHISALDSLFSDPRFSNQPNFKYLPPVNKLSDRSLDRSDPRAMSPHFLGYFKPWGRTQVDGLTYAQTVSELQYYQNLGYMQTINFDPTSGGNRLVGQFFEKSAGSLRKLDVIDYGIHSTGNQSSPIEHIFFVGKVEVDEKGTDTFLHLFTLVFGS